MHFLIRAVAWLSLLMLVSVGTSQEPVLPSPSDMTTSPTEDTRPVTGDGAAPASEGQSEDPMSTRPSETSTEVSYASDGLYLLEQDADGVFIDRIAFPGFITEINGMDTAPVVKVQYLNGSRETIPLEQVRSQPAFAFDSDPDLFTALRSSALGLAADDVTAAWTLDPTNPWLARASLERASTETNMERLDQIAQLGSRLPFFETFAVANALLVLGATDLASSTLDEAMLDFAARGYKPALVFDPRLREAYSLPDTLLRDALERNDLSAARILAPYAQWVASAQIPSSLEPIAILADRLTEAGDVDEAGALRATLQTATLQNLGGALDRGVLALSRLGWWAVAGILTGTALLWLVLMAKVYRPRVFMNRQRRERGGSGSPIGHLWVVRYASTTEKIVLALLLTSAGLMATLANWHDDGSSIPASLQSGTLASTSAFTEALALPETPEGLWIRGLAHAQRNEITAAMAAWESAGAFAPALVNRAVLTEDETAARQLIEEALALDPNQPTALFLLGRSANPSAWHDSPFASAPTFALPSEMELRSAMAGSWQAALASVLREPWRALPALTPSGIPTWAWYASLAVYGVFLIVLLLMIFIPRPRITRNAPRTFLYHLGALLVPGSGHADELWGLLLLLPWSIVGVDALMGWQTGSLGPLGLDPTLSIALLAIFWSVNLIGFMVELVSYRERMWRLREREPDLAAAYGLTPTRPSTAK